MPTTQTLAAGEEGSLNILKGHKPSCCYPTNHQQHLQSIIKHGEM